MGDFIVYIIKSAVCLAMFYLFYKLLLSRDTFHRFNRITLLGILVLSCVLPLLHLSVQQPTALVQSMSDLEDLILMNQLNSEAVVAEAAPPFTWQAGVALLYVAGVAFFFVRNLCSLGRMLYLVRSNRRVRTGDGLWLIIHHSSIAPFSWMHYIVISDRDLQEGAEAILTHERAHIRHHHSWDLLVAELCVIVQWFNPAAWLLKHELQNIHEYEADEAVLHQGIDAKQYQLLLIKKAVGSKLYGMANSFNHYSLKNRISMMLKPKSSPWARVKYLYVLPLAAVAVASFARPEVSNSLKEISHVQVNDLTALVQATEADVTADVQQTPVKKTGKDAPHTMVDKMPQYPGGAAAMAQFLADNLQYPKDAEEVQGKVYVRFVVSKTGEVKDVSVLRSLAPAYDAEAMRVVKLMPKWTPGMQNGKAVDVWYTIPIVFSTKKASQPSSPNADDDKPFTMVEQMPEFPGGQSAMMSFIAENIKYPEKAMKEGVQGKVYVRFVVNKEGKVEQPQVIRSLSPETDAEAIRVIESLPRFEPGTQGGKPVSVYYTIPLMFKMGEETNTKADLQVSDMQGALYVVDGKKMTNEEFKRLKTTDIADISVLKSETARSIYGAEGKNGVILVTTHQHKEQKAQQQ